MNRTKVKPVTFTVGTDILEVKKMEQMVAKGKQYLETIFTKREMDYCDSKSRKAEHYAARYAAKEAILKALGSGWRNGIAFSEIEVTNDDLGKPQINLYGKAKLFFEQHHFRQISISLSHTNAIAMAVVICEKQN